MIAQLNFLFIDLFGEALADEMGEGRDVFETDDDLEVEFVVGCEGEDDQIDNKGNDDSERVGLDKGQERWQWGRCVYSVGVRQSDFRQRR